MEGNDNQGNQKSIQFTHLNFYSTKWNKTKGEIKFKTNLKGFQKEWQGILQTQNSYISKDHNFIEYMDVDMVVL